MELVLFMIVQNVSPNVYSSVSKEADKQNYFRYIQNGAHFGQYKRRFSVYGKQRPSFS